VIRFSQKFAAALLSLMLVASAPAEEVKFYRDGSGWVEETTGSVPAGRSFNLMAAHGSAQVKGAPGQNTVTYVIKKHIRRVSSEEAARREASYMIVRVSRGEAVTIRAEGGNTSRISAEYFITVPKSTELVRIHTMGGSIGASTIDGRLQAETAGGSISMDDIGGTVIAETMGGGIDLTSAGGDAKLSTAGGTINIGNVNGRIVAETSGGNINVAQGKAGVAVETAGGNISVRQCANDLRATTAGGSLEIGDVGGAAELETAGGNIRLLSAKGLVRATTAGGGIRLSKLMRGAIAETMAGPIEAEFIGARNSLTDSRFETSVGDIVLWLPSDIAATIKASIEMANGHRIRSDFEALKITTEGGQYGPREIYGDGALNGGGPMLKAHTTNGNIEFRKTNGGKR
jgi:DUF4097 and DUF4098 domain-containing protein YvlB